MNDWLDTAGDRHRTTTRAIRVAAVLSILVHVVALWTMLPQLRHHLLDRPDPGEVSLPLTVQLAPPPAAPAAPAAPPPSRRARERAQSESAPHRSAERVQPAPPAIALKERASESRSVPPPAVATAPARPLPGSDLSSYIEERRRGRAEPAPPAPPAAKSEPVAPPEDDATRSRRIVASNLGLDRKPSFGPDPNYGGGVFHIQRLGYNDAEFVFYGWNKDIRRNTTQVIEVQKGNNTDIRLAVVRRMISIIREYEDGDFTWESKRLGRNLTLSARPRDQSGLEDFLLREFTEFGGRPIIR